MINRGLLNWYKIDTNKNLNLKIRCPRPFDTMLFDKNGEVYACECTAWLPVPIGNINLQEIDEILQNKNLKILQDSITDSSYRYCNNNQCSYIVSNLFAKATKVKHIRLAVDESCNLECPSCRNKKIFIGKGPLLAKKIKWLNKIIEWIKKQNAPVQVHIGSDGDPFVSLAYRHFMKQMQTLDLKTVSFSLQTNGLLIKKMYKRLEYIFDHLNVLNISIDGATKDTYEKLRLGGLWEKIIENLQFIKEQKKFPVYLHMVVQKDNWHEMGKMLELADQYNFEKVYFNEIENWNTKLDVEEQKKLFTSEEYLNYINKIKNHSKARLF